MFFKLSLFSMYFKPWKCSFKQWSNMRLFITGAESNANKNSEQTMSLNRAVVAEGPRASIKL